ncbi:MAG TPA: hypothetical protein VMG98_01430 [Verrucomicrobiae bacterium]|nr:hypothetical protein [Verrucomicrobiae bacterium]
MKRAIIIGFEYFGRQLARLMADHADHWSLTFRGASYLEKLRAALELRGADALVCFGGPGPDAVLTEVARRYGVPVVVIWAGTDVVTAARDPELLEVLKQDGAVNVSVAPWLADELRALGVEASYVPVGAVTAVDRPAPLPTRFRVISYLPEPRRAFYGEKAVYSVAAEMPDVQFTIVGNGERNPIAPRNVEFLGYVGDMTRLIDESVALLRLPEHDGKSMLVLESLARGRHVVWTYDFPGVARANSISEAIGQLRRLQIAHQRGELGPNEDGLAFVRHDCAPEKLVRGFEDALDRAELQKRSKRKERPRRVVLSGYSLFSAQIANAVRGSSNVWEPRVLRGTRRFERIVSTAHMASANVWYTIGTPIPDRWLHIVATILRKPRVVHWVGSDVMMLKDSSALLRWCRQPNVTHLAEVDWMIDELAQKGINAHLAPLPPQVRVPDSVPPMPDTFTVLLYMPRSRGEFYGLREYERLFRAFARKPVRFLVVGGGSFYAPPDCDIERMGWCTDLSEIYRKSSVLLRFTRHDGLSLMALEALSYGRHLIWTKAFPFGHQVASYDDCKRTLEELLKKHLAGQLASQHDAAAFIRTTYDRAACIDRIEEFWRASVT